MCIHAAGGGQSEEEYADSQDDSTNRTNTRFKGCQSQGRTVKAAAPDSSYQNYDAGDGTDYERIHKDFKDAHQTLANRVVHFCGSMDHRSGTPTGLVAEYGAGHTGFDCQRYTGSHEAAQSSSTIECTVENESKHFRKLTDVDDGNVKACQNIEDAHKGNHLHGKLTHRF